MSEEFVPTFGKKAMDSQEARNAYWNEVSREEMESVIFRKRSRKQTLDWFVEKIQEVVKEGTQSYVLDLGCGYSELYEYLLESGFSGKYQGADPAIDIVYQNTKRHPYFTGCQHGWWQYTSIEALRYIMATNESDPDVITFVNVHGSFKKSEALNNIGAALQVAKKRVIVVNLDHELYQERAAKSTHKFQSFTGQDYAEIAPEEWAFETGILGTRHRYAVYTKVL